MHESGKTEAMQTSTQLFVIIKTQLNENEAQAKQFYHLYKIQFLGHYKMV